MHYLLSSFGKKAKRVGWSGHTLKGMIEQKGVRQEEVFGERHRKGVGS